LRNNIFTGLVLCAAWACTTPTATEPRDEPVSVTKTATTEVEMDELTGFLTMDPVAGGKRFQGTWIESKGVRHVVSYRPVQAYFAFQNKRVVARGERYMPGPHEQHIDAPHFRVKELELADGEVPHDPPLDRLATPPTARSLAEADAVPGRWVRLVGKMSDVKRDRYGWLSARLQLSDGVVELDRMSKDTAQEGVRSVVCAIVRDEQGDIEAFGAVVACDGDVERCGMSE
jgi:hypothetical protein